MEQIKVNMTPCGFTPTIHASQNDNATRKWAFDLYDENGKIDSSSIKEQMIFDSRVGGTEQILPENGSDPTTSPIIADIQYPDSLRSEQTFLYRESPTTVNGQSKITHIKGNTVVFNQLVQNGNFADTSNWTANNSTLTVSNNVGTVTATGNCFLSQNIPLIPKQHKAFFRIELASSNLTSARLRIFNGFNYGVFIVPNGTALGLIETVFTIPNYDVNRLDIRVWRDSDTQIESGDSFTIKNVQLIDLTQMFGAGNEPSTTSEFESWLNTHIGNLPYYDYTQGKLLPFKGESLKTTGKNLLDKSIFSDIVENTLKIKQITVLPNTTYFVQSTLPLNSANGANLFVYNSTSSASTYTNGIWNGQPRTVTTNSDGIINLAYRLDYFPIKTPEYYMSFDFQIAIGNTASSYEPYTSSTINLPTLNYFPTGMKSTGTVYDEITESKAITRVGAVDLGTLAWSYNTSLSIFWTQPDSRFIANDNYECAKYEFIGVKNDSQMASAPDKTIGIGTGLNIKIKDSAYTDASSFAQAMSGVLLYHELKMLTEESITTASLVTSKGESPLYYDDELIADCNETISSESGIFDAKIKLMTDETIYSQKIQLHVERKP